VGPGIAEKVSNENDERSLDGDKSWFELDGDQLAMPLLDR
jgi:hypothetical protein